MTQSVDDSDIFGVTSYGAIQNRSLSDIDAATRTCPGTRGKLEKLCPNCGEWVGLGGKGATYSFHRHQDGERCRRTAGLKALARVEEALSPHAASTSFRPNLPMLLTPPVSVYPDLSDTSPAQDIPMAIASPSLSPLVSLPPLPPERTSCVSPDAMVLDGFRVSSPLSIPPSLPSIAPPTEQVLQITSHPGFPNMAKIPCHGVRLKWEHGHPSKTYPFQYHDTDDLKWSITTQRPPDPVDTIYLRSFSCTLFHDASTEACFECLGVPSSDKFRSLVLKSSKDPPPTMPWGYLSWEQISRRLRDRTDECRRYRKKVGSTSLQQT